MQDGGTYGSGTYIQQTIANAQTASLQSGRDPPWQAPLSNHFAAVAAAEAAERTEPSLRVTPGLEIRLVPLVYYCAPADGAESEECPICCEKLEHGQPLRMPPCAHKFHAKCLRLWFQNGNPCCPTCRTRVGGEEEGATRTTSAAAAEPPTATAASSSPAAAAARPGLLPRLRYSLGRSGRRREQDAADRPAREPWPYLDY